MLANVLAAWRHCTIPFVLHTSNLSLAGGEHQAQEGPGLLDGQLLDTPFGLLHACLVCLKLIGEHEQICVVHSQEGTCMHQCLGQGVHRTQLIKSRPGLSNTPLLKSKTCASGSQRVQQQTSRLLVGSSLKPS